MTEVVPWKLPGVCGGSARLGHAGNRKWTPMDESGACHCCQRRNWAGKTVIVCFDSQSAAVCGSSE